MMIYLAISIFLFVSLVYVAKYEVPKRTDGDGAEEFLVIVLLVSSLVFLAMSIAELRDVYFS
ncbi:hypothetical protein LCGC14_2687900 [marine sediment metagenome]|uniref:Uncharacterized protein n=1 Tax=marine sediment metagenome TaxID=412755 RepID=A0A0F9A6X4_9ZZZZ